MSFIVSSMLRTSRLLALGTVKRFLVWGRSQNFNNKEDRFLTESVLRFRLSNLCRLQRCAWSNNVLIFGLISLSGIRHKLFPSSTPWFNSIWRNPFVFLFLRNENIHGGRQFPKKYSLVRSVMSYLQGLFLSSDRIIDLSSFHTI